MGLFITDQGLMYLQRFGHQQITSWNIVLFKEDVTVDESTVIGDLTLCNFDGYEAAAVTNVAPFINAEGASEVDLPPHTFAHDGGGTPNTVYGYALINVDTSPYDMLIGLEKFNTPIEMDSMGDLIPIAVNLTLARPA